MLPPREGRDHRVRAKVANFAPYTVVNFATLAHAPDDADEPATELPLSMPKFEHHSPKTLITSRLSPAAVELGVEDRLPRARGRAGRPSPAERPGGGRAGSSSARRRCPRRRGGGGSRRGRAAAPARRRSPAPSSDGGASLSSHSSVSSRMPGSSSLTHTPAVMCIAETSTMPSCDAGLVDGLCTSSVIRTNSRRRSVSGRSGRRCARSSRHHARMDLGSTGRVAVVTGASRGIGAATVRAARGGGRARARRVARRRGST